ncbi:hypothetical protein JXB12_09980 [candidate division KSB1 bacterium]|nr:hypothetical protein [candidate division KSB1 bacterium]
MKVTESNLLSIDFHAEGLIDDKIIEGLLKGRTSTLEYKVQLWGKKAGIINQLIHENFIRLKISYDFWEKKYVIMSQREHRMTNSIETVREKTSEIVDHAMISESELSKDIAYIISIEAILKPLSVENYEEIKGWLSGEIKDIDEQDKSKQEVEGRGINRGLLRMFMAITGFGDKIISCKTEEFNVMNHRVVFR